MEIDNQLKLDEFIEKSEYENPLHVIMNGKSVKMSYEEIFDPKRYFEIKCVTFVSSPRFFFDCVKDFKHAEIILGIADGDVKRGFAEGIGNILLSKGIDFFNSLPDEGKQRVSDGNIKILYACPGYVYHSKIYILSGENGTRVVTGSVNFTQSAFSDRIAQYEEAIIFDAVEIVSAYEKRYAFLHQNSVDFIPEEIKKKFKSGEIFVIDKDAIMDGMLEKLSDKPTKLVIEDGLEDIISEEPSDDIRNVAYETLKSASTIKAGKRIVKSPSQLKLTAGLKTIVYGKQENLGDKKRYELLLSEERIFFRDPVRVQIAKELKVEDFGIEGLRKALENLDHFIRPYIEGTYAKDQKNASRVYEAILYALSSTFIWRMRKEMIEAKLEPDSIPLFCIVEGAAYSGKTSLMKYISLLLSGNQDNIEQYADNIRKNTYIEALMREENVFPLIVNEASQDFFTARHNSSWTKKIGNTLDNCGPAYICSMNLNTKFSADLERRVYDIRITDAFIRDNEVESDKIRTEVFESANQCLLTYVHKKAMDAIQSGKRLFAGNVDFLRITRDIMLELYEESGVPVPEYFPHKIHNSIREQMYNDWKNEFLLNGSAFTYDFSNNLVRVNLETKDRRVRTNLLNSIPGDMKSSRSNATVAVMEMDKFFAWIEEDKPKEKKGWFSFLK